MWSLALLAGGLPLLAEPVPAEAMKSATAATKVLGEEILKQNYSFAFQRMHPRYKARAAVKAGGEEKLAELLKAVPKKMKEAGITILTVGTKIPNSSFVVPEYREWLVFVPTIKTYLIPDPETAKVRRFETKGYQVAVAKAGTNDWHFIDGAKMSLQQLRSIFPSLPNDAKKLNLPEVSTREILKEVK